MRTLTVVTGLTALALPAATTILHSPPVIGGAACTCSNLTDESFEVTIALRHSNGGSGCTKTLLSKGFPQTCNNIASDIPRTCAVTRTDGAPVSSKTPVCILMLDASGTPTVAIPVNLK
jgi:hypothetical protein